jgi:hypothetical protein
MQDMFEPGGLTLLAGAGVCPGLLHLTLVSSGAGHLVSGQGEQVGLIR